MISNVYKNINIISIRDIDKLWDHIKLNEKIQFFWLGSQSYQKIWELQKKLHAKRVENKINDIVLLLEHDHVYTFGKNANKDHLLNSRPHNADVIQIDRGGEVTYHGPGQLVCYPIIDLNDYKKSISWYMRSLEKLIINFLNKFEIVVSQKPGLAGVWINDDKICAMGVRISRWVTMHGFALNVKPQMEYFDGMIPCGIFEYGITSLSELGIDIDMNSLVNEIVKQFLDVFLVNNYEI